ncbi:hypothetical protein DFH09DRAFT_1432904, partial [Mycena vulgaris]
PLLRIARNYRRADKERHQRRSRAHSRRPHPRSPHPHAASLSSKAEVRLPMRRVGADGMHRAANDSRAYTVGARARQEPHPALGQCELQAAASATISRALPSPAPALASPARGQPQQQGRGAPADETRRRRWDASQPTTRARTQLALALVESHIPRSVNASCGSANRPNKARGRTPPSSPARSWPAPIPRLPIRPSRAGVKNAEAYRAFPSLSSPAHPPLSHARHNPHPHPQPAPPCAGTRPRGVVRTSTSKRGIRHPRASPPPCIAPSPAAIPASCTR